MRRGILSIRLSTDSDAIKESGATPENPSRVVWALAWPAVALNSLQVVNTLLDRGFIGHLHTSALTAHGGSMNVMFLMFSVAMAIATAATALVSRSYGAEDFAQMRKAAQESLSVSVYLGLAIALASVVISPWAADALMPPNAVEARKEMSAFLLVYSAGLPGIFVIQALAGSLRGIGDTRSPMVISGVQILLHIVLNFLLIFPAHRIGGITIPGGDFGLTGAAMALSGSATASAIAYVIYVRKTPLGALAPFRLPDRDWIMRILRIAVPAAVMATLRVLSLTAFTLVLKRVSNAEAAIAAMGIGFAIESIMFMPAFGLSAAASALVGQSLGMRRPERAEKLAWVSSYYGMAVTFSLALPIYVAAPSIASTLVEGKVAIAQEASTLLRYLCMTEFLFGLSMVLVGAMQGAGDTKRPLWISIISLWGLRVPLALFLALPKGFALGGFLTLPFALGLGANGAWIAMAATQGIQGIISFIAFRQGAWKTQKV